jgi:excisionase family DNA binding protein
MHAQPEQKPLAYRINTFCDLMGIGRSHFYNLVNEGQIRTIMIGERRLVPASEAERLLASAASPPSNGNTPEVHGVPAL